MAFLEIDGLARYHRRVTVLEDLTLHVEAGEFVAVLGPSGSGKTTLLRVIAGFERANAGSIRLGGAVVDDGVAFLPPERRRIGYVPQEGGLFPHLTVAANVGFGLDRAHRRGARVDELLELVGLAGLARRYPHQLSGGQQQRVALARGLAVDPTLLLLDEPFASLDASLRGSLRQDVRRIVREAGTTTIFVTHDQDEALSLADRVAVLSQGRIAQIDAPVDLYAHPASPGLATSLGSANVLTGIRRGAAVETPLGLLDVEGADGELARDGASVAVLVRPEQLQLGAAGEGPVAHVVATEFYGHDAVATILVGDATLTARTADVAALPRPGDAVAVAVRGRVRVWPLDGEPA